MHVLWVNEAADFAGGAERYVAAAATLLRERGIRCSLLYGFRGRTEPRFTACFDGAFPMVLPRRQVQDIAPDIVYVHRLDDEHRVTELRGSVPVVRFLHDHKLFCPREHKYTTIGHRTCTRIVDSGCYTCLGVVRRSDGWPPIRLRTVGVLKAEQAAQRHLAALVVGSEYMKKHVAAHGFDPAKIHVMPPFVVEHDASVDGPRDKDLIVFAGALVRGKGLDVLLGALALLPSRVRLEVVGSGHQESMFRRQAARLGLSSRVSFLGEVDGGELHGAYGRATCVVVPSRSPETFGLVGPEAMLHGAPVIASNVGGVGEWLLDGVTGLCVPPCDSRALACAIQRVLGDAQLAAVLGKRGCERSRARFAPSTHADSLIALFASLAGTVSV